MPFLEADLPKLEQLHAYNNWGFTRQCKGLRLAKGAVIVSYGICPFKAGGKFHKVDMKNPLLEVKFRSNRSG